MEYYYLDDGAPKGPFSRAQLLELCHLKSITQETLVSVPGDSEWLPLKDKLNLNSNPASFSHITTPKGLGIWDCYKRCLKFYATFSGRATRKEYWSFSLINSAGYLILAITSLALLYPYMEADRQNIEMGVPVGAIVCLLIVCLASIALLVPSLAVTWRRLHDAGFSGWFFLFFCIPYVGGLIGLIFALLDSTKGDNAYGPSEKYPQ